MPRVSARAFPLSSCSLLLLSHSSATRLTRKLHTGISAGLKIRLGSLLNLARLVVVNLLIVRFQTDVYEVWSFSFVAQKELILLF